MTLGRLRWITMVAAIAFLVSVQAVAMIVVMPNLGKPLGHAASIAGVTAGVIAFSIIIFRQINRMQREIVLRNEELAALNAVARAAAGSLELEETMTRTLSSAMEAVRGSAGEIALEARGLREPKTFVLGPPDDVAKLRRLAYSDSPSKRPSQSTNGGAEEPSVAFVHDSALGYLACVPLTGQKQRYGVMRLLVQDEGALDPEGSQRMLTAMGREIALAIRSSRLYDDVLRREREAEALYEIALDIASLRDAPETLRSIVERARDLMDADDSSLRLINSGGLALAASTSGPDARPASLSRLLLATAPAEEDDTPADEERPEAARASSGLRAPLRVGGVPIGELSVSRRERRRFSRRQVHLLTGLADLAAIAVENGRLLDKERYSAVLEERERLSRELHDSLAQVLAYLHLKTLTTLKILADEGAPRAQRELEEMATQAHEAYVDVREAILGLRETVSPSTEFVSTLQGYLEKFSRHTGLQVDLDVADPPVPRLPPAAEVQLLRVIQEALANVRKHARADKAHVRLTHDERVLMIAVEDAGRGFDTSVLREDGRSFGLAMMRERVERAGGEFRIESAPQGGTRVEAVFPLSEVSK